MCHSSSSEDDIPSPAATFTRIDLPLVKGSSLSFRFRDFQEVGHSFDGLLL